jgi:hypothetical protein
MEREKDPLLTGKYDVYFQPQNRAVLDGDHDHHHDSSSSPHSHRIKRFVPLLVPTNSLLSGASGSLPSPPNVISYKSSSHRRVHSTLESTPLASEEGDIMAVGGSLYTSHDPAAPAAPFLPPDASAGTKGGRGGSRFFLYVVYALVRDNASKDELA